jgi:hypothetical protein
MPFVVLFELDYCHFPFTLITKHGNKSEDQGSTEFKTYSSFFLSGVEILFPFGNHG